MIKIKQRHLYFIFFVFLYCILIYRINSVKSETKIIYVSEIPKIEIIEDKKEEIKVEDGYIVDILINEDDEHNTIYLGQFKLTGYCDCYECQEEWVGTTALGVSPTPQWTIAVDPNVIPLGSIVVIDGKEYRAEDTGGAINQNRIDMFMPSHSECYSDICNGYKDVYLKGE